MSKSNKKRLTVTRCAKLLKITRTHLSLVIHGHRESKRLMKRIREKCPEILRRANGNGHAE